MNAPRSATIVAFACDPLAGSEPYNGWMWALNLSKAGVEVELVTSTANRARLISVENELAMITYVEKMRRPRGMPRKVYLYANYAHFLTSTSRYLIRYPRKRVVHHVTWGSINFGSVRVSPQDLLIWGPVGGSHVTPSEVRRFFESGWRWERFRNAAVKVGARILPGPRASAQRADLVYATNMDTKRTAGKLGARRTEILLADAVPDVPPLRTPTGNTLLWVGRMLPIKGALLAIDILAELKLLRPDLSLTLVGDGPEYERAQARSLALGLGANVNFVGRVPRQEVEIYYERASAFLFTSLRDSFGAQLLEAARHSLPLITFSHQPAAHVLPARATMKIESLPTDNLAVRAAIDIAGLWGDPARRADLGAGAWRFASANTWENHAEAWLAHVRQLESSDRQRARGSD